MTTLRDTESLAPQHSRLLRRQGLPGLHVVFDAAPGFACWCVPIMLALLPQWRQDPLFPRAVELFAVLRSLGHFVAIWTSGNLFAGRRA